MFGDTLGTLYRGWQLPFVFTGNQKMSTPGNGLKRGGETCRLAIIKCHDELPIQTTHILRIFQHTPGTYPRTPNQQFMRELLSFGGFGEAWGMLQGYVGIPLDTCFFFRANHSK